MLRFLTAASLLGSSYAALNQYVWPGTGSPATGVGTPLAVLDPIDAASFKNQLIFDKTASGAGTYVGIWNSGTTVASHTENGSGGPLTKVTCANSATCTLKLYQSNDVMSPLPAGTYTVRDMDESNLDYANVEGATLTVTISPYIAAWGNTLQQVANTAVERGNDIYVTWSGLTAGDSVELRYTGAGTKATDCALDFHLVTTAEGTAGGGTTTLKTAGAYNGDGSHDVYDLVQFGVSGNYQITGMTGSPDYDAGCTVTANRIDNSGVRTVVMTESDTLTVGIKTTYEAGTNISLTYDMASAITSGTYVGLFKDGTTPASHTATTDDSYPAQPKAKAYLPVGFSGEGKVELTVPIEVVAGNYIVYMFNDNENTANVLFTPLADTSYTNIGEAGPFITASSGIPTDTDVAIISAPTGQPTDAPTGQPSGQPSGVPTSPTGQPTGIPTSSPSFVEEPWGEYVWTEKRHRKAGMCENQCSGHGTCEVNGNCKCFKGLDGEDEWTGPDCSSRTCPFDFAWVGSSINSNNLHPWAECSNKGLCDRESGECQCFTGYEGAACQRTVCPDNCNDQGTCWPEKHLASKAGRVYDAPWDAMKHVGCLCDAGFRGPACDQQECPSGADPLAGYGNEAGRDCSGRGICDYSSGICACFTGFFGTRCQHQTTVM